MLELLQDNFLLHGGKKGAEARTKYCMSEAREAYHQPIGRHSSDRVPYCIRHVPCEACLIVVHLQ